MDDLISRKALLEELQEAYDNAHRILQNQYNPETQEFCKLQLRTLRSVIKDVKEAPTIDAEPVRHGEWVVNDLGQTLCSKCHRQIPSVEQHGIDYWDCWEEEIYDTDYCPNCGAKMDGGAEDG